LIEDLRRPYGVPLGALAFVDLRTLKPILRRGSSRHPFVMLHGRPVPDKPQTWWHWFGPKEAPDAARFPDPISTRTTDPPRYELYLSRNYATCDDGIKEAILLIQSRRPFLTDP